MRVYARQPWYADHLAPIVARVEGLPDVTLVASYPDLVEARREGATRTVLAQHGAGQSYSGTHPHYPGGDRNDSVGLFLVPNEFAASRWRAAYPSARVEVVGSPRLDDLPARQPGPSPVVALAWHWEYNLVPETRSALPWYSLAVRELAARFRVIGTGHPRRRDLARFYQGAGIEFVPSFAEVCRRADVLAFDNTSAGFEFAATGRPVVVLDAPWYRRRVDHGLRFWDAADVGVRIGDPADLAGAVERALACAPADVRAREAALAKVYPIRHRAADRAAAAIVAWAS